MSCKPVRVRGDRCAYLSSTSIGISRITLSGNFDNFRQRIAKCQGKMILFISGILFVGRILEANVLEKVQFVAALCLQGPGEH